MKYKVSLLPESRKNQINARKTISKIKSVSLVVLAILFAFYAVVFAVNVFARNQLKEVQKLDQECILEIQNLSSYHNIHAALQERIQLFDKIQVTEPYLYQFILDWSDIDHPGVSVESILCTNWKTDRLCTIVGTCETRAQYLAYEKALSEIEGVTSVSCVSYTSNVGGEEGNLATFTISVSVSGGVEIVETTVPVSTTVATTAAQ